MARSKKSDLFKQQQEQIDRLANFIMAEVDGEPSQSQGAVDTAIRIIRECQPDPHPTPTKGD